MLEPTLAGTTAATTSHALIAPRPFGEAARTARVAATYHFPAALGATMAKPAEQRVEVSEHWIAEWLTYGYAEMRHYLERHAEFDQYLAKQEATMHRTTPDTPAPAPQPNPPTPAPGPAPAPQPNPHQ